MAYTGRVATIVSDVLRLGNDKRGEFVKETDCLSWINMLQSELADEGYWTLSATLNTTANTGTYDLTGLTFTPSGYTFMRLDKLYWIYGGLRDKEIEVCSRERLEEALSCMPTGERVRGYYLHGTTLHFVPVPTAALTAAMRAWCYVLPATLTGADPYDDPYSPATYDQYYTYGCLEKAAMKDKTNPDRMADMQLYRGLKDDWKRRLLRAGQPTKNILKPYRQ